LVAQSSRTAVLSRQLDEVHAEYAAYQDKVDQHFRKTADLLNALSTNYSAVHQHLALGVQTLSQRNLQHITQRVMPLEEQTTSTPTLTRDYQDNQEQSTTANNTSESLLPPKDYAPKNINDPGMLSETYSPNSSDSDT
ncbi:MAG: DUF1043 family protein, partial [Gammaproteobacteria bacterium]